MRVGAVVPLQAVESKEDGREEGEDEDGRGRDPSGPVAVKKRAVQSNALKRKRSVSGSSVSCNARSDHLTGMMRAHCRGDGR